MISLSKLFWDHQPLRPAPRAHVLDVGGRAILFDEAAQQIFELNDSSEAVWDAVGVAGTIAGAAGLLGEGDAAVMESVRAAVAHWLELGLLTPDNSAPDKQASTEVGLAWRTCRVGLTLSGAIDAEPLRRVFAGLLSDEPPDHRLSIREMGGVVFIADADGAGCARTADTWIPEVKARLTSRVLRSTDTGFLAHAALLSRNGQGVLICGEPGAGKTTLSVSLLLAGFGYQSDDIVWIGEDGRAIGAPFSPALKAGSWPLLNEMGGVLATSDAYLRSDGQAVKYLFPPTAGGQAPLPIGAVLLLARGEGEAHIEPVEPLEVLAAVLNGAYAERGAISATGLKAMADTVTQARIGRLRFADWRDGRRLVETFAP